MSETTKTPNYNLIKPNVNADADLWGDHLNSDLDTLDTIIKTVENKSGVVSFNGRNNVVSLTNADVVTVLPPSAVAPAMDGTASAGVATTWSKSDHVHPTDTSRYAATNPSGYQTAAQVTTALGPYAPLNNPVFTGDPRAPTPTAGDNDTSIATTAFVTAAVAGASTAGVASFNTRTGAVTLSNADVTTVLPASSTTPTMNGTAAVGTGTTWARADHVHPSDTTLAPLASPLFTGDPRAPNPPVGDNDFSIATTSFVTAAVGTALHNVGRNVLHNPLFNVAQRGAGPFTAGGYTLDRWNVGGNNDTWNIQQVAASDAIRAAIGDEAATNLLQVVVTGSAVAGALTQFIQPIEILRRLSGKTVTLSFWANCASGALKLGVNYFQHFGTGGSPSAAGWINTTGQSVTLSTAWTRYSVTTTIPTASGKALGTNNNDFTYLGLFFSSGATSNAITGNIGVQSGTINIWGVQLELGSGATPLEKPDPQQDLAKCQRFYCIGQLATAAYNAAGAQSIYWSSLFPTQMRAAPTITVTPVNTTNCGSFTGSPYLGNAILMGASTVAAGSYTAGATFTASADL